MPLASIPSGGVGTPFDCGPYGATVTNLGPSTLYYRDEYPIDSVTNFDGTITAGSSTTLTGSRWAFVASGSATLDILPGAPTGQTSNSLVLNVKDVAYGAVGNGVTDDYDAIQAAINAAAVNGGVVYFPAGTYYLNRSGGNTALRIPLNMSKRVTLRGAGVLNTVIKTSANTPTFIGVGTVVAGDVMQNVTVEELTVNANSISGSGVGVICQFSTLGLSCQNITIRRCQVINAGTLTASGNGRRCIAMAPNVAWPAESTTRNWSDILIEDCDLGLTGGGGNTGVHIGGGVQGGTRPSIDRFNVPAGYAGVANHYFDRITVRNVRWVGTSTTPISATSSGIQIGGSGQSGQVRIQDCWLKGSGDVGIEVDSCLDLVVSGTTVENSYNAAFFIANNHGGLVVPERMSSKFVNCVAKCSYNGATFSGFAGYAREGSEFGTIAIDNCSVVRTAANFGVGGIPSVPGFSFVGPMRAFTMRDCSYTHRGQAIDRTGLASGAAYTLQPSAVRVYAGGASRVLIDGFDYEVDGTIDQGSGTGAMTYNHNVVDIHDATKCHATVKNIRTGGQGFVLSGAITPTVRMRDINLPVANSSSDDLSDGTFLNCVYFDSGLVTEQTQSGGTIVANANPSTKRRMRWLWFDSGSTNLGYVMRQQDASLLATGLAPSTLTGFELGGFLKGSDDGQSYLEGVLVDDGSASALVFREVVSGVVTTLGSTPVTRIVSGSAYGVRFIQRGNVLTLDLFTSAATQTLSASPASTASFTLSGGDTVLFGADAPIGWLGVSWTPVTTDATLDLVRNDRLSVLQIAIERVTPRAMRAMSAYSGVRITQDTTALRLLPSTVDKCDFTARKSHGTVLDIENVASQKTFIGLTNHAYGAPPTMNGTITAPGSGVAYTNSDMFTEDVYIYGGTLTTPFVEVSRDQGTTFAQIAGVSGEKVVRLAPGDQLRTTYSSAPTFRKVPVL